MIIVTIMVVVVVVMLVVWWWCWLCSWYNTQVNFARSANNVLLKF
jgi:hypothetical protein